MPVIALLQQFNLLLKTLLAEFSTHRQVFSLLELLLKLGSFTPQFNNLLLLSC
jgi:hypothetical protein